VGSERCIFSGTECISAVKGHPRSLILAPIERAYVTSYYSLIVTLGGLNAVLMRRQSCVEAYAEDAQAPASSFRSEKEGSLSKA